MHLLNPTPQQKRAALEACEFFTGQVEAVFEMLEPAVILREYDRGETIFWEKDVCSGLHIVKSGSVKLFKLSEQGKELIITVREEGESFNEVPVFDEQANPVNAAALELAEVWLVPCETFREAMTRFPALQAQIIRQMSVILRQLVNKMAELSFYQVPNRLARLIAEVPPEQLTSKSPGRITQNEMAARLGTAREVVARSLRQLERSGAIQNQRGEIRIIDQEILDMWIQNP